MSTEELYEIPVSGSTPPKRLATAIQAKYKGNEGRKICLVAIGMSAVMSGIKGVIELNKKLAAQGMVVSLRPAWEDRMVSDRTNPDGPQVERTATILYLHRSHVKI